MILAFVTVSWKFVPLAFLLVVAVLYAVARLRGKRAHDRRRETALEVHVHGDVPRAPLYPPQAPAARKKTGAKKKTSKTQAGNRKGAKKSPGKSAR